MPARVGVVLTFQYLGSRTARQQNRLGSTLMQFLDGVCLLSDLPDGVHCARLFRRPPSGRSLVLTNVMNYNAFSRLELRNVMNYIAFCVLSLEML